MADAGQPGDLLRVRAPAKVNLTLDVLGRRPDGYHELRTVMQAVSLYDELTLRTTDDGRVTVHCDHPGLPDAEDNLVVHAAHAARAAWGVRRGVRVDLVKGIPVGGGLGGGSSDAAVTLLALADLWGVEAQGAELEAMAAGLGSDVAFFLSGGTALCEGRGERVSPLACGGTFHYVLVLPDYGVSTERVYGAPRSGLTEQTRADNNIRSALDRGDTALLARSLRNDLQGPALTLCPDLAHLHERVTGLAGSCGLAGVLLSGSGSTLLAVANGPQSARRGAHMLEAALRLPCRAVHSLPAWGQNANGLKHRRTRP